MADRVCAACIVASGGDAVVCIHKMMVPDPPELPAEWKLKLELTDVNPELVHLIYGCAREWPHDGLVCCYGNIVLGEE